MNYVWVAQTLPWGEIIATGMCAGIGALVALSMLTEVLDG